MWRRRRDRERSEPRPAVDVRLAAVPPAPTDTVLDATAELDASESGVEFVYRALERLRRRSGVDDVFVVVDQGPFGRQAFRAGRRPIDSMWAREVASSASPGVHANPAAVDQALATSIHHLCSVALRLDLARHDSLHDPLTGLLNRRAFDEVLVASCAQAARYSWTFALVLLDLDGFKKVNDRLGHYAGDVTLRAVGDELRDGLRVGDAAARLGGDEFALVLPNARDIDLAELVPRIESAVERAVPGVNVTVSAGLAFVPDDGVDPEKLYRRADARLYERKASARAVSSA